MRKAILLIVLILLYQTIYSQDNKQIDWNTDLDYLSKELPEKHYNLFSIHSKEYFLSEINTIKSEIENLTNFQISLKLQQLIAKMGDSHTSLNIVSLRDKKQMLPLYLYWFSDGIYILQTNTENKRIIGSRLLSINKIPITTVIDSLSTLFTIDNQAIKKTAVPRLVSSLQTLQYFGITNSSQVELEIITDKGQKENYLLESSETTRKNLVIFKPDSISFLVKNEKAYFTDFYSPNDKIYYMLYNRCHSQELELKYGNKEKAKDLPSFKEFEKNAFNILANNPVDKIVFDMRYNGGGNSSQGTQFIKKMAAHLKNNPDTQIYVVVGRQTFSSAILNSLDFKQLTNAIFVGEETSGKPNHFGEVRGFQLPNSGLGINYSTKYFKKTNENMPTITPDIIIETSFTDFKKGIDPVYEWIKNQ